MDSEPGHFRVRWLGEGEVKGNARHSLWWPFEPAQTRWDTSASRCPPEAPSSVSRSLKTGAGHAQLASGLSGGRGGGRMPPQRAPVGL